MSKLVKKTTVFSMSLAALLLSSAGPALGAVVGNGGSDNEDGGGWNSGVADTAYCVYVRDGKNAADKPMWKAVHTQLNDNKSSASVRYKKSPNCPGNRIQMPAGWDGVREEVVVAGFDARRWNMSASAIVWRAYYSGEKLKGWSVSRANFGGLQPGKIKSYMATGPHPEDIGNKLATEDGGFEGPDRAFATKYGKLAEEELMGSDATRLKWRKLNTKQDRNDNNKSPYVTSFPVKITNPDGVRSMQVDPKKDVVYKAVHEQLVSDDGKSYSKETKKWLNDNYVSLSELDDVGKWLPLGVMNMFYANDNLGQRSSVRYEEEGDGLKISSMFDLMPEVTFIKGPSGLYEKIDVVGAENGAGVCILPTIARARYWKYIQEEGNWDKLKKTIVIENDFIEELNYDPLKKPDNMGKYNKWVKEYNSETIWFGGERFMSPNTDPDGGGWTVKDNYDHLRKLIRNNPEVFDILDVKEPTKLNPDAQRTALYAANHATCQYSKYDLTSTTVVIDDPPPNPTLSASLTGAKTGYAVGNDVSKAAQIVGTTTVNKPADVKFESLRYNIRIEAPAGYRYGTTGKAYKFASTSEIQQNQCTFEDNGRIATCRYDLLNKYPALAQYPNTLNFNLSTSANLVFYAPTPANGSKYKINSWISAPDYSKAVGSSVKFTVPGPATTFKLTGPGGEKEVDLKPEFTIPALDDIKNDIVGSFEGDISGGSKNLPVVGSVSAN